MDDIILSGDYILEITKLKSNLHRKLSIKDFGRLNYFLGIEVGYLNNGITSTQKKINKELISDTGLKHFRAVVTPLSLNL